MFDDWTSIIGFAVGWWQRLLLIISSSYCLVFVAGADIWCPIWTYLHEWCWASRWRIGWDWLVACSGASLLTSRNFIFMPPTKVSPNFTFYLAGRVLIIELGADSYCSCWLLLCSFCSGGLQFDYIGQPLLTTILFPFLFLVWLDVEIMPVLIYNISAVIMEVAFRSCGGVCLVVWFYLDAGFRLSRRMTTKEQEGEKLDKGRAMLARSRLILEWQHWPGLKFAVASA